MATSINSSLEEKVKEIGKEIFRRVKSSKLSAFDLNSKLMQLAMNEPALKTQLFRFVDVLPALKNEEQLNSHIKEYFSEYEGKGSDILKFITQGISSGILGKIASSFAVKTAITQMGKTFISGENTGEVIKKIVELRKKNMGSTVDILGELVLSEKEANYYQNLYLELITELCKYSGNWNEIDIIDRFPNGKLPKANVSVKLSSLYSQADPIDFKNSVLILKDKLRPILRLAKEKNAFVYLDMESYFYKGLTLSTFKEILMEDEFINWGNVGIVIQAYLKDSEKDLIDLINSVYPIIH